MLVLVTIDGVVAVAATALVRASAARVAVEDALAESAPDLDAQAVQAITEGAQREASAALNVAFMGSLALAPALGGALVHAVGGPTALLVDALTFLTCAGLFVGLGTHVKETSGDSVRTRLFAAVRHVREVPALRALFLTEAVAIVVFASVEPVEVLYAKSTLRAGDFGFGLLVAAWGVGAALGAIVFARSVRRPLGPMLTGGTLLVGLGYLGFAAAPTLAIACAAGVVGGIGNGIQWPSLISAVQQLTPSALHGRLDERGRLAERALSRDRVHPWGNHRRAELSARRDGGGGDRRHTRHSRLPAAADQRVAHGERPDGCHNRAEPGDHNRVGGDAGRLWRERLWVPCRRRVEPPSAMPPTAIRAWSNAP